MTTLVTDPKTQPAVILNMVHFDSFTFKQKLAQDPVREVDGAFRLYGFDTEGNRVFDNESVGFSDHNMDTTVVTEYVTTGKGSPETFVSEYYTAKDDVAIEYTSGNLSDAKLMAYFELSMSRVAELNGKLTISGLE